MRNRILSTGMSLVLLFIFPISAWALKATICAPLRERRPET